MKIMPVLCQNIGPSGVEATDDAAHMQAAFLWPSLFQLAVRSAHQVLTLTWRGRGCEGSASVALADVCNELVVQPEQRCMPSQDNWIS